MGSYRVHDRVVPQGNSNSRQPPKTRSRYTILVAKRGQRCEMGLSCAQPGDADAEAEPCLAGVRVPAGLNCSLGERPEKYARSRRSGVRDTATAASGKPENSRAHVGPSG